jgi:hypothetical protein
MEVEEQIKQLNALVNRYYSADLRNGENLNEILQKMSALLYYLETVRSQVHDAFESAVFEGVKDGKTVSRAVNEAHVTYPLMYKMRRVMDSGYRITDAIRTNISYLKSEINNKI